MSKPNNRLISYGKSSYLRNLSKRKRDDMEKIEEKKASMLIDKILGRDGTFVRDYSIFAINTPTPGNPSQSLKMKISPGVKVSVKSQFEVDYPKRYEKKKIESDQFAQIYKSHSSRKGKANNKGSPWKFKTVEGRGSPNKNVVYKTIDKDTNRVIKMVSKKI